MELTKQNAVAVMDMNYVLTLLSVYKKEILSHFHQSQLQKGNLYCKLSKSIANADFHNYVLEKKEIIGKADDVKRILIIAIVASTGTT